MKWVPVVIGIVALVAVLYGLHRAALWAAARGWIYYRNRLQRGRGFGEINRILTLYDPSIEHIVEERIAGQYRHIDDEDGLGGGDPEESPSSPEAR